MDDVISLESSEDNSNSLQSNSDDQSNVNDQTSDNDSTSENDSSDENNTISIDLTSVNDNLVIIQENQHFNSMLIGIFLFFVVGWFFMNNIFRRK